MDVTTRTPDSEHKEEQVVHLRRKSNFHSDDTLAGVEVPFLEEEEVSLASPSQITPLDNTISKIGFGKFQRQMLFLCGFGWLADNMWLQCVAVILPRVQQHFQVPDSEIGLLSSSIFTGMMVGSLFWGLFSDSNGRQSAFNWTLAVAAFFGIMASMAPSFFSLCVCLLFLGFGVGGNMPVDGALFLEFIPRESQHLLTFLSVFFSFGAVLTSLLAWLILPGFSCQDTPSSSLVDPPPGDTPFTPCNVDEANNGWRYLLLVLGLINLLMVVARVLTFHLPESPKFLMAQNRTEDVLIVLRRIVSINGSSLSVELGDIQTSPTLSYSAFSESPQLCPGSLSSETVFEESSGSFNASWGRVQPLLRAPYLKTTILVWIIWTFTSFAYTMFNVFLPKYLELKGEADKGAVPASPNEIYASYLVYSLCGIPGSLMGGYMVETFLGRKGSMAVSVFGAALGLLGFVTAVSQQATTITSGIISFLVTIAYAVIYAYTPEVFDAKVRGTACGIASALGRIAGIIAPLVTGSLLTVSLALPNYLSSGMFMVVGVCMLMLPIETKGRAN